VKEIVVISGKGGTGKTSITASFAYLGSENIVVADCDVDAADLHMLLGPDFAKSEDFFSGEIADINQDICTKCGKCADVCHFNAIPIIDEEFVVEPLNCEGCGYCARICPVEAITNLENNVGKWFISNIKTNSTMIHARLGIGAENSGKLVAKVKNEAKKIAVEAKKEFVLVDGSPGIGCPVVSSLSGASFVVIVTEATVAGFHDMKRVFKLVKMFNLKAGCIINKYNLNLEVAEKIETFMKAENIIHIANLPYDDSFTNAMVSGKTIIETDKNTILKSILINSWKKIKKETKQKIKGETK